MSYDTRSIAIGGFILGKNYGKDSREDTEDAALNHELVTQHRIQHLETAVNSDEVLKADLVTYNRIAALEAKIKALENGEGGSPAELLAAIQNQPQVEIDDDYEAPMSPREKQFDRDIKDNKEARMILEQAMAKVDEVLGEQVGEAIVDVMQRVQILEEKLGVEKLAVIPEEASSYYHMGGEIFDQVDANGDGNLSYQELVDYIKDHRDSKLSQFMAKVLTESGPLTLEQRKQKVEDFCTELAQPDGKVRNDDGEFHITRDDFATVYAAKVAKFQAE